MKTLWLPLFLLLICYNSSVAQDMIKLKSGDELNVKILRINPKDITCIPHGITDTITMWREDIVSVRYQNGTIVNLMDEKAMFDNSDPAYDSMYSAGVSDAKKYYTGYKGAANGTLASALVFPYNIIPAIACSATTPKSQNLGFRDKKLMENPAYNNGYTKQAHKIKKKKVWTSYAIGSGVMVIFYIVITSLLITAIVY